MSCNPESEMCAGACRVANAPVAREQSPSRVRTREGAHCPSLVGCGGLDARDLGTDKLHYSVSQAIRRPPSNGHDATRMPELSLARRCPGSHLAIASPYWHQVHPRSDALSPTGLLKSYFDDRTADAELSTGLPPGEAIMKEW